MNYKIMFWSLLVAIALFFLTAINSSDRLTNEQIGDEFKIVQRDIKLLQMENNALRHDFERFKAQQLTKNRTVDFIYNGLGGDKHLGGWE